MTVKKFKESPENFLQLAKELYKDGNIDGSFEVINEGLLRYPDDETLRKMFRRMVTLQK